MKKIKEILKNSLFTDGDWIETKDQDPKGEVRLIQLADVGDGYFIDKSSRYINKETAKKLKCTYLKSGDVLVARMPDPLGRACVFPLNGDEKYVTAVDVCIMRPDKDIDNKYLMYAINGLSIRSEINRQSTGTTRKRISRKRLGEIQIPLPSLPTQKKIAEILDAADALRKKTQQIIEHYDQLAQSIFLDMFGDPVSNPKGWKISTIEELISDKKYSLKRGPFGGALKKEIFVESGYLIYEQYHALNNDFTFERYYIDESKFEELKAFEVKPDDLIISCSGVYLGKLAVVPKDAKKGIINQALLKITLDESKMQNDFFVFHFTQKSFKYRFFDSNRGAGIPNFPPMSEFKKFPFINPPIELQNQFVEKIELIEKQKELAKQSLKESEDLFQALMQKAFKGELV